MRKSSFTHYLLGGLICISVMLGSCRIAQYHKTDSYQATMIGLSNKVEDDPAIVDYIAPFKQQLEAQMSKIIGISAQALPRTPRNQSLGGNFFAEALLALGKELDPEVSCAVGTKDGIRVDIPQGAITVGHIFELMPFENYLTILTVKGSDLLVLGDFIARTNGQPIAGISVIIRDEKLVEMRVNNELVQVENTYKLATYDYLANGGDHIQGLSNPVGRMDTPIRIREGLISHIESLTLKGQRVQSVIDERIKILQ